MSNPKHTPGPWRLAQDGSIGSIEATSSQMPIGHSFQTRPIRSAADHMERIANARLMAAAPELLEALQGLVAVLDRQLHSPLAAARASPLGRARAAIAKATGDTE